MQPQDLSQIQQHLPPAPPLISAVETPQAVPQPNADNAVSSDRVQQRIFRDWFGRRMKTSCNQMSHHVSSEDFSRNQTPGKIPSEDPSCNQIPDQIPSADPSQICTHQATAPPLDKKSSMLAPGERRRVSMPLLSLLY